MAAVASQGDLMVLEIGTDFGVAEETVRPWIRQADIDEGIKDGVTSAEQYTSVRLRRPKRRLEREDKIVCRAAA